MRRHLAFTFVLGSGLGIIGCQTPMLSGLPGFGRSDSTASTAPDVSKQKFNGLSQQAASTQPSVGMGGNRQPENLGVLATFKKSTAATTAAISGAVAAKPKVHIPEDDPLRLDKMPKRIGSEVYVGAARLLENQGKFAEAEDKYREALKASPTDLNGLVGLARLYDRQGQPQKAIELYQTAAKAHPNNGLILNDLGLCLRRQRQVDKSVVAFRRAVELMPGNAKYRNNLAAALVDAGKENEAYAELAAVNSPAVAHYNLAYLCHERGQRASALAHLQEALAADPSLKPAGEMLAQLGGSLPHSEPAATADFPSYHVSDDSGPALQTAQRPAWTEGASSPSGVSYNRPLPPVE